MSSDSEILPEQTPANASTKKPAAALSPEKESQLFWRLRKSLLSRYVLQTFQQSRLRASLVVILSLVFWLGLYFIFYAGFRYLISDVGSGGMQYRWETIDLVFHLFFASLNIMLFISAAIILYTSLFHSPATTHLLNTPTRPSRIVLFRFQETVFFSSWGFLLLGSPMMIAYGVVMEAAWYYYVLLIPLMLSFVYIPCGIGAIFCLLVVYRLPKFRIFALSTVIGIVVVIAIIAFWKTFNPHQQQLFNSEWVEATMQRFQITRAQLLPSTWLTVAALEFARTDQSGVLSPSFKDALKFLGVLIANALFVHVLVVWVGSRYLRTAHSRLQGWGKNPARLRTAWIDRVFSKLLFLAPHQVRMLLLKDFRVFRRDPVQWSQFLIFFGLLILYFMNMDRFGRDPNEKTWINMVSFLNLAVVGLILSTFTTRFIFPMLSLEGSRFWILGLLPVKRSTIVWGKFFFAAGGTWFPCALLVFLSDLILQISIGIILVHQITCVMLSVGLSAIAVGLGAAMPTLNENSPSKIAAGFGGTINLVLSASFILVTTLLTALPVHFYTLAIEHWAPGGLLSKFSPKTWLTLGLVTALILTLLATAIPLRMGLKAFKKMEF